MKFGITNHEDLEQALERLHAVEGKIEKSQAKANEKIEAVEAKLENDTDAYREEMVGLRNEIEAFMRKQLDEHGIRSKTFPVGTVTLADTAPRLQIADKARALKVLLKKYPDTVRVMHKIELNKLRAKVPVAELTKLGIKLLVQSVLRIRFNDAK